MQKVQDYKALSRAIMTCMRPGLVTNSTLSGEQLRMKIEEGLLYMHVYHGGLLLFEKKPQAFLLRFYLTDPAVQPELVLSEPVICECVFRPDQKDVFAAWLKNAGFCPLLRRIRMERQSTPADDAALSSELDGALLRQILSACFSAESGCIPSERELGIAAAEGRILTKIEDGKICALLHAERRKGCVELRHLAVLPEYRAKGYAKELVARFVRIFGKDKLRVWVREDELAARHIYEQSGFLPDGYSATVWKKEG